jgi:hypothetical protein
MQISLRKANALQNSITDTLRQIDLSATVNLNEFEDPEQVLDAKRNNLLLNITRKANLISTLYEIRKAIAAANVKSGVNQSLADAAEIEKKIQLYAELSTLDERMASVVVSGKLNKIRNDVGETRRSALYGYKEGVESSVLNSEDIKNFKSELNLLKKQKQKIQDDILEANVSNTITLTTESLQVLSNEGLV